MTFSFYMDVHIPASITAGLRRRTIDILTSQEDKTTDWPDLAILERAALLGSVLFTCDEDFLQIHHKWQSLGREHAGIIYLHQLAMSIGRTIDDLELLARYADDHELRNQVVYLPLR